MDVEEGDSVRLGCGFNLRDVNYKYDELAFYWTRKHVTDQDDDVIAFRETTLDSDYR